jgi:hypothetical protein
MPPLARNFHDRSLYLLWCQKALTQTSHIFPLSVNAPWILCFSQQQSKETHKQGRRGHHLLLDCQAVCRDLSACIKQASRNHLLQIDGRLVLPRRPRSLRRAILIMACLKVSLSQLSLQKSCSVTRPAFILLKPRFSSSEFSRILVYIYLYHFRRVPLEVQRVQLQCLYVLSHSLFLELRYTLI